MLSLFESPNPYTVSEQEGEYDAVLDRLTAIGLYQPDVVDHSQYRGEINQTVQTLPVLATKAAYRPGSRSRASGIIRTKAENPTVMKGRLAMSFNIS